MIMKEGRKTDGILTPVLSAGVDMAPLCLFVGVCVCVRVSFSVVCCYSSVIKLLSSSSDCSLWLSLQSCQAVIEL